MPDRDPTRLPAPNRRRVSYRRPLPRSPDCGCYYATDDTPFRSSRAPAAANGDPALLSALCSLLRRSPAKCPRSFGRLEMAPLASAIQGASGLWAFAASRRRPHALLCPMSSSSLSTARGPSRQSASSSVRPESTARATVTRCLAAACNRCIVSCSWIRIGLVNAPILAIGSPLFPIFFLIM